MAISFHKVAATWIRNIKESCCPFVCSAQQIAIRLPLRRLEGRERSNDFHLYMLSYPSSDCRRVDERNGISKGLGVNKLNILMQEICFADWALSEMSFKIKKRQF